MKEQQEKNYKIDMVLKRLVDLLKLYSGLNLIIELIKQDDILILKINNEEVYSLKFAYDVKGFKVYIIENLIYDLLYDNFKYEYSNVDVIVEF